MGYDSAYRHRQKVPSVLHPGRRGMELPGSHYDEGTAVCQSATGTFITAEPGSYRNRGYSESADYRDEAESKLLRCGAEL